MYCNRCGQPVLQEDRFCSLCGSPLVTVEFEIRLPEQVYVSQPPAQVKPPVRKGTLWIPALVLAAMCVVGLVLFRLFPGNTTPAVPSSSSGPFTNQNGYLFFNEALYNGPEELTVPATVGDLTVRNIGEGCFEDCDNLTTVYLPETLRYVENWAFYDCDSLRGVEVPDAVLYIGKEAFADCDSLEALRIPASIETLDPSAFDNCDSLKYVFFTGTTAQWKQIFDGCEGSVAMVYCTDGKVPLRKIG